MSRYAQEEFEKLPKWLQELWDTNSSIARDAEGALAEKDRQLKELAKIVRAFVYCDRDVLRGSGGCIPWPGDELLEAYKLAKQLTGDK